MRNEYATVSNWMACEWNYEFIENARPRGTERQTEIYWKIYRKQNYMPIIYVDDDDDENDGNEFKS